MVEISENLHRKELTTQERSGDILKVESSSDDGLDIPVALRRVRP
jgi:hypothetical protein